MTHLQLLHFSLCAGCEVCERVAFYAISSNLVIYLTTVLHEDVAESAKNVNNWGGTTFMTPLIGAFVADAFLGRYWTIATFSCGYFLVCLIEPLTPSHDKYAIVGSQAPPLQPVQTKSSHIPTTHKSAIQQSYPCRYLQKH